jgi:hypothetical protein
MDEDKNLRPIRRIRPRRRYTIIRLRPLLAPNTVEPDIHEDDLDDDNELVNDENPTNEITNVSQANQSRLANNNDFSDLLPSIDPSSALINNDNLPIPCPEPNNQDIQAKPILLLCQICYENQISTVHFPCMHSCLCSTCAHRFAQNSNVCPICRSGIMQIAKIFYSSKDITKKEDN